MSSAQTSPNYDPKAYWNTRTHPNTTEDAGLSPHDAAFLRPHLTGAQSVLEIGPGVGRLFPLYRGIPRVATVDLSFNYRDRAQAAAARSGLTVEENYLSDPRSPLPFTDDSFDVGVTSHVLMHVPFENIEHSMSEAARCCRRVVVISVLHRYWPRKGQTFDPKWHCFTHDYEAICRQIGCHYGAYTLFVERESESAFGFVFSRDAAAVA